MLEANKVSSTALKIILQANQAKQTAYLLSNLSASYATSLTDINVTKDFIDNLFLQNQLISFSQIFLPKNIIYNPGFTVTSVQKFSDDCPSPVASVQKSIVNINGAAEVKYSANNGNFCDHFSYQNLPHNQAYLLVVNSQNQTGLPLTLCVKDYTSGRCDIYANLSSFKTLDKDVFLLPPMDGSGNGYDVDLSNLGIKDTPAVNYLSSVDFIPIPYTLLQNIQTANQNGKLNLTGKIEKVTKYSSAFYLVKTNGNPTIVNLNFSFEKGFRAYYLNCSSNFVCTIKASLAPFFTKEIPQHVLVNNWSNGWLVNGGDQIVIIFLPQYLEYLGFILLFVPVLLVLVKVLASKVMKKKPLRID